MSEGDIARAYARCWDLIVYVLFVLQLRHVVVGSQFSFVTHYRCVWDFVGRPVMRLINALFLVLRSHVRLFAPFHNSLLCVVLSVWASRILAKSLGTCITAQGPQMCGTILWRACMVILLGSPQGPGHWLLLSFEQCIVWPASHHGENA